MWLFLLDESDIVINACHYLMGACLIHDIDFIAGEPCDSAMTSYNHMHVTSEGRN